MTIAQCSRCGNLAKVTQCPVCGKWMCWWCRLVHTCKKCGRC